MITKTMTRKFNMAKFFGLKKQPRSSVLNKQLLIKVAKNGESRPSQKTRLGKRLSDYTKKTSRTFDATFYKIIKKLRPDWFVSQTEKADKKKIEDA